MLAQAGAKATGKRVEHDGNIITGNGPSSAIPFALAIAAATVGQSKADEVSTGMLV